MIIGKPVAGILKTYQDQNSNVAKAKAGKTEAVRSAQKPDEVILSSGVQGFGAVLQSVLAMSDVRDEKVAAYQKAIEDGSYHVESKDIAQRMIGRPAAE